MAIVEDVSSPAVVKFSASTSPTLATSSFTPPAGASLELVLFTLEFGTAPGSITTPTVSSSAGGAWNSGPLIKAANVSGVVMSFWRYNASAPGAHTVTVTRTEVGSAAASLTVRVLTGTDTSLAGAATQQIATVSSAGTQQTVTPVRDNSYIGVAASINTSGTLTVNGNTTQFDFTNDTSVGAELASGRGTSLTGAAGVGQSLGWTGVATNTQLWVAQEVFVAPAAVAPVSSIAVRDRPVKRRILR